MEKETILIVEDEKRLAGLLTDYLVQAGYRTHCLHTGSPVLPWVRERSPALILLDQMLPEKDGLSILRELRAFSQVPVIMITAKTEEIDRLMGLETGADDYICKPFSFREVVARVKAVLRRNNSQPAAPRPSGIHLDDTRYTATLFEKTTTLTVIEFNLLKALASRPGTIFTRDRLMDHIYPDGRVVSDRTIDSHVRKLRYKLSELHPGKEMIFSVYSAGYKFDPPN